MAYEPRVPVNFLISPAGKDWLRKTARSHQLPISEVIRIGLGVARKHEDEFTEKMKEAGGF